MLGKHHPADRSAGEADRAENSQLAATFQDVAEHNKTEADAPQQKPERHLGLYFLLTGVDYLSYAGVALFRLEDLYLSFGFIARVAYVIAVFYLLSFIRSVFRPSETWATWVCAICAISLITELITTSRQRFLAFFLHRIP